MSEQMKERIKLFIIYIIDVLLMIVMAITSYSILVILKAGAVGNYMGLGFLVLSIVYCLLIILMQVILCIRFIPLDDILAFGKKVFLSLLVMTIVVFSLCVYIIINVEDVDFAAVKAEINSTLNIAERFVVTYICSFSFLYMQQSLKSRR